MRAPARSSRIIDVRIRLPTSQRNLGILMGSVIASVLFAASFLDAFSGETGWNALMAAAIVLGLPIGPVPWLLWEVFLAGRATEFPVGPLHVAIAGVVLNWYLAGVVLDRFRQRRRSGNDSASRM